MAVDKYGATVRRGDILLDASDPERAVECVEEGAGAFFVAVRLGFEDEGRRFLADGENYVIAGADEGDE